ncbi:MAG: hypothetical protein B6I38_10500 [Anaerolineaceae bacterium 4572_5.1]|nr:MAG: hypothetical protein B6I38_10500 [Anaerolineaceae bacterium 4572_5.1]RLD10419.1 MAG: hypothetical protein DRI56_02645 [Chloroflexota bacterium]
MGLHISAIILTEWLFIAGWFSENSLYNWGALAVVIIWGISWQRDKPRWPGNRFIQVSIYIGFGIFTVLVFFLTKALLAFLAASLIFVFMFTDLSKLTSQ